LFEFTDRRTTNGVILKTCGTKQVNENLLLYLYNSIHHKMNTIIQILHDNLPTLKAKYPLLSLGVYGSYSRGEETENSDLDIVYETLPDTFLNLHNYLSLQKELSRITHLKIDLVNKKKMNEVVWLKAKKDVQYV